MNIALAAEPDDEPNDEVEYLKKVGTPEGKKYYDVRENNKRLPEGPILKRRLEHLFAKANEHLKLYRNCSDGMLLHACIIGRALCEAYERLGRRKKWTRWRNASFDGSRETAIIYMRVARHWMDPRIVEARKTPGSVESIRQFLAILRNEGPKAKKKKADNPSNFANYKEFLEAVKADEKSSLIKGLLAEFKQRLEPLQMDALEELRNQFEPFWQRIAEPLHYQWLNVKGNDCPDQPVEYLDDYPGPEMSDEEDGERAAFWTAWAARFAKHASRHDKAG